MPSHLILKGIAMGIAIASATGSVQAQGKPEYLILTNRGTEKAEVKIRGSNAQGERQGWQAYTFAGRKRLSITLQKIGFQPFDVVITETDGTQTELSGQTLCTMMDDCKRFGLIVQGMSATVAPAAKTKPRRTKSFNAAVAENTVEFDFGPFSVLDEFMLP